MTAVVVVISILVVLSFYTRPIFLLIPERPTVSTLRFRYRLLYPMVMRIFSKPPTWSCNSLALQQLSVPPQQWRRVNRLDPIWKQVLQRTVPLFRWFNQIHACLQVLDPLTAPPLVTTAESLPPSPHTHPHWPMSTPIDSTPKQQSASSARLLITYLLSIMLGVCLQINSHINMDAGAKPDWKISGCIKHSTIHIRRDERIRLRCVRNLRRQCRLFR